MGNNKNNSLNIDDIYYVDTKGAKDTLLDIYRKVQITETELYKEYNNKEQLINEELENGTNKELEFKTMDNTIEIMSVRLLYKMKVDNKNNIDKVIRDVISHSINWHKDIQEASKKEYVDFGDVQDSDPFEETKKLEKDVKINRDDMDKGLNEEVTRDEVSDYIEEQIKSLEDSIIFTNLLKIDNTEGIDIKKEMSNDSNNRIVSLEDELKAYISDFKNQNASRFAQKIAYMIPDKEIEDITSPEGIIDKYKSKGKKSIMKMGEEAAKSYAKGTGKPTRVILCLSIIAFVVITVYQTGEIPIDEIRQIGGIIAGLV